jgi:osmotically-inducible protein OsmY
VDAIHRALQARRTDTAIAEAARQALDWSTRVPREQVQVTVQGGHVTLNGEVECNIQRLAARSAPGVTEVINDIVVAL